MTKSDIKSGGQLAATSKVIILVGPCAQTMFVHVWYPTSGHAQSKNKCSRTVRADPLSCLDFVGLHHSQISPTQVACQFPPSLSNSCMLRTVTHPLFPQLSRVFRLMVLRIPILRALHRSCLVPGPWFLVFIGVVHLFASHVIHLSSTFSTPLCM